MKKFLYSNLFFLFFLSISIFAIYGKSLSYQFVDYDTPELITDRMDFISDYRNIPSFFLSSCFGYGQDAYYRPILTLSFAFNAFVSGSNPEFYYLTNIVLFILSIYCIYLFLRELKFDNVVLKFVCLAAAVHPACVSSVVWIPARNDTLLIIFLSLSFLFFVRYVQIQKTKHLIYSSLLFMAALFTKETAVILLPVYFMTAYCFNIRITKKQTAACFYAFGAVLFFYFFMRHISVDGQGMVARIKYLLTSDIHYKFLRILTYAGKIIMPDNIPVFLYKPNISLADIFIAAVFVCAVIYAYYKKIINGRILVFSGVFFALNMLLVLMLSDLCFHRVLFAMLSFIVLIVSVISRLNLEYVFLKKYFLGLFIIVFTGFGYASFVQADKYKNSDIFWTNAFLDSPEYDVVWNGVGKRYLFYKDYKKAKEFISGAKKIKNNYDYDLNLVTVYIAEGNLDEAESRLLKLLRLKENLTALLYLSEIYYVKGDIKKSYDYALRASAIQENNIFLLLHQAKLYGALNDWDAVSDVYSKLLKLDGKKQEYYYNLNIARAKSAAQKNTKL